VGVASDSARITVPQTVLAEWLAGPDPPGAICQVAAATLSEVIEIYRTRYRRN
jgi:hypothetical protein